MYLPNFVPHTDFEISQCAYIASDITSDIRLMVDFGFNKVFVLTDNVLLYSYAL